MVLPIEIAVTDTNATTRLAGEMQIGVCKDICVPVTLNFDTVLPSQGSRDGTIVGAMLAQPFTAEEAGGAVATCRLRPIDDGLELTADVRVDQVGPGEIGVLEVSDPLLWVSEADYTRSGERVSLQADIIHPEGKPIALDRSGVRISLIASNGVALDIRGCTSG